MFVTRRDGTRHILNGGVQRRRRSRGSRGDQRRRCSEPHRSEPATMGAVWHLRELLARRDREQQRFREELL